MLDPAQTEVVSRAALAPPESPARAHPPPAVDWSSILGYTIDDDGDVEISGGDTDAAGDDDDDDDDVKPAEVEFHLFAPARDAPASSAQKFVLPPTPPPELGPDIAAVGLPGDLPQVAYFTDKDIEIAHATHRPSTYYLTPPLEEGGDRAAQIRASVVSGEEVVHASTERWPGCELPWRITHLSLEGSKDSSANTPSSSSLSLVDMAVLRANDGRKRHRPNKKRRIILRKRRVVEETKAPKNATKKKTKAKNKAVVKRTEQEDREKRTRLNRLKKVRRKLKLKDKPAAE
ncbi:hypothetical protein DRE_03296 [Drechslerella stenobrocha 248]|uniref:Uncharacterized protein n=1 Tax=Drechslerella stenobrocha 248 TaxID=1043628 RepID=W7HU30_9PEZI|nr:hypothetical protein DRE_03296 [Drechslerella stenobrocha 248]